MLVGLLLDALVGQWGRDGGRRLPVFVVDSKKTPAIATHVRAALAAGHPRVLTRAAGPRQRANRRAACGHWPQGSRLSCDEYPFASTLQGGRNASIAGVPRVEQRRQGGALRAFYPKERVRVGDQFLVVQ
jgi:Deoxyribonuclease NucA/NucB